MKEWLKKQILNGYAETRDQALFTQLILEHHELLRTRMRSYRRLVDLVEQLLRAARDEKSIVSPVLDVATTPALG